LLLLVVGLFVADSPRICFRIATTGEGSLPQRRRFLVKNRNRPGERIRPAISAI
jgi:hypothetical protein